MCRLHHLASSNDVTTLLQVIYQLFVAPFSKPKNTMGRDYNGQQLTCANKPSCTVHSDDSFQFAAVAHLLQKMGHLRTPLSKITSTGEIEQRFRLN